MAVPLPFITLQVPPFTALLSVTVAPSQTEVLPLKDPGVEFTETARIAKQPVTGNVYETVVFPTDTPVIFTVDEEALIVAVAGAAILQFPPAVPSVKLVTDPIHTDCVPAIAAGFALTVIVSTPVHDETVLLIIAVPAVTPVTIPEEVTVATPVAEDTHDPPPNVLESVVAAPTQTAGDPVTVGVAFTVIVLVPLGAQPVE